MPFLCSSRRRSRPHRIGLGQHILKGDAVSRTLSCPVAGLANHTPGQYSATKKPSVFPRGGRSMRRRPACIFSGRRIRLRSIGLRLPGTPRQDPAGDVAPVWLCSGNAFLLQFNTHGWIAKFKSLTVMTGIRK